MTTKYKTARKAADQLFESISYGAWITCYQVNPCTITFARSLARVIAG